MLEDRGSLKIRNNEDTKYAVKLTIGRKTVNTDHDVWLEIYKRNEAKGDMSSYFRTRTGHQENTVFKIQSKDGITCHARSESQEIKHESCGSISNVV